MTSTEWSTRRAEMRRGPRGAITRWSLRRRARRERERLAERSGAKKSRSPYEAIYLHPVLAALIAINVGVVTAFMLWDSTPTYTAEATVVVGRVDVAANAVPGFVEANNTLAGTYSRFIGTSGHMDRIAELRGADPEAISARVDVTGTNVAASPIIRVRASSPSEAEAVEVARDATTALLEMVTELNSTAARSEPLFEEHAEAALSLAAAESAVDELRQQLTFYRQQVPLDEEAEAETQLLLENALVDLRQQQLRVDTLAALYQESLQARADGSLLRVLTEATSQGSDAGTTRQLAIAVGILTGGLVSVASVWAVANVGYMRQVRQRVLAEEAVTEPPMDLTIADSALGDAATAPGSPGNGAAAHAPSDDSLSDSGSYSRER